MMNKRFSVRLTTNIMPGMDARLNDILVRRASVGRKGSKSSLICEAIRILIEMDDASIGSRKQIAHSVEVKLETLAKVVEMLVGQNVQLSQKIDQLFENEIFISKQINALQEPEHDD